MNTTRKNIVLLISMIIASVLAVAIKPTHKIANDRPPVNLEKMIPKQFASWVVDESTIPVQVSTDVQEQLNTLYSQILSKTYINDQGQRIMLSISYGGNQGNDEFQVHRPEYCYVAQGFKLNEAFEGVLALSSGKILVRRLEAIQGARVEPITYWITIGDQATLPGIGRKIAQLKYGLTGKVPDGMLVRVSSISNNQKEAYRQQDAFINELINAVSPNGKVQLLGKLQ
jgi:EpsI family protein